MFFWNKKNVKLDEEFRLVEHVEKARKSWSRIQGYRIAESESLSSQIPRILVELRYRYLLRQARKRKIVNRWYYEEI